MITKSLEEQIQYMKDVREIQNLMNKYCYLHTAGMNKETADLFTQKTPGARVTVSDLGVWEGIEGVRRFYEGYVDYVADDRIGKMEAYTITNPIIEVAGDGKTAKAAWISPGALAIKDKEGNFKALWHWVKGASDFVKEDGKWKFWHYHLYTVFRTPFEQSWVEAAPLPQPDIPDDFKPDRTDTPDYPYSTTSVQVLAPVPPEPYQTFDEKTAY